MTQPALVTGGSSGIGLATVRYLAERNVPVYTTVRRETVAGRLNAIDGVEAFLCDVTDDDQVGRLGADVEARGVHVCAVVPGNFASAGLTNLVERFAPPVGPSDELRSLWTEGADTSRSWFPSPDAVAAACHAALFDPDPLERYLVTPNEEEEAHRALRVAAWELVRLNRSTPYRLSPDALAALLDEVDRDDGAAGKEPGASERGGPCATRGS